MKENPISRRDFGKVALLGLGAIAFPDLSRIGEKPPTGVFGQEIAGSDRGKALGNINEFFAGESEKVNWFKLNCAVSFHFRDLVEEYKAGHPYTVADELANKPRPLTSLGSFVEQKLKVEGVYESLKNLSDVRWPGGGSVTFKGSFKQLDRDTYQKGNRPLECIGFAIFLAGLHLPISPIDISGVSTSSASGILDDFGIEQLKKYHLYVDAIRKDKRKASGLLFKKIEDISEVMVSDIFLLYGGGKDDHVGVVIGRKVVDGETVLLVTDANKDNDGRVHVFEVNRLNFKEVFESRRGPPIVVIKKNP